MSSGQMLQTYAKEAATLLLAEVEKYCIPVQAPTLHLSGGSEVDPQQLSLDEISGGLRSIQTAPTQQQRPSRSRDAWGWLEPGRWSLSVCLQVVQLGSLASASAAAAAATQTCVTGLPAM